MDPKEVAERGMKLGSNWVTSDNIDFYKNFDVHKCTAKDLERMYPANDNYAGQIDLLFEKMFCFDPNEIELYGNFNTDYAKMILINLSVCDKNKRNCKSTRDLSESWPYLVTITNSQRFE